MKGNHLITTDAWFYAPDGKQYKAVWGNVQITDDTILGIKTNAISSNWFAKVGTEDNYVIVAGCQIHYAVKCDKPNTGKALDWTSDNDGCKEFERPSVIYIAE